MCTKGLLKDRHTLVPPRSINGQLVHVVRQSSDFSISRSPYKP